MSDTTDSLEAFAEQLLVKEEPAEAEEAAEIEEQAAPEQSDVAESEAEEPAEANPEDDGEDAPEEEQTETPVFKVKVDGEEIEVTQDELLRGYSGQAKIQKGLREVAEARKEAEAFVSDLLQQREAVFALVQEIQQTGVIAAPVAPDPSLAESDPVGYVRANAAYQGKLAQYMQQQQMMQQAMQQHQAQQQMLEAREIEEGTKRLIELIPELGDAEKAPQVHRTILEAGERYGYSREEIGSVKDPRALQILYKAARLDALEAANRKNQDRLKDKVAKAGPILKPTAKPGNPAARVQNELRQRFKNSGRIEDAAALLLKRN